jgi:hypothetical protein
MNRHICVVIPTAPRRGKSAEFISKKEGAQRLLNSARRTFSAQTTLPVNSYAITPDTFQFQ